MVHLQLSFMRLALRRLTVAIGCALPLLLSGTGVSAQATVRAVTIAAAALESADAVRHLLASAVADGATAIVVTVPVYGAPDSGFDGVTALIAAAHDRGLQVRASVLTNVVTTGDVLPASRDHVLYQHPEWLMVPRAIAPEMLRIDVHSPGYIGRLARWARANRELVAGLYLSPLSPAAADYAARAVDELVRRYAFDELDVRAAPFPEDDFDYSRLAIDTFRSDTRSRLGAAERARMDEIEAIDPFAYPDEYPGEWRLFRRSRLDDLVARVSASARAARPSLLLAAGDAGTSADAP